ncbi:uncharacterized protein LOC132047137 [Lycium ferocissimum]|uniref:uncharacterized protein LOC132047137 n=1 Tax=Lycium ferocissimum TaxID=112874 RepID=UPI002815B822|nr:uncharacterized protein LOC132047137 [Lycium ferocissimum]
MKSTVISTPNSSVKSSSTTMMESENKDSYYFPGCRKDTNCNCEICIASFNATLDLMTNSMHKKNSITKRSITKALQFPKSPISFSPSNLSTPKSSNNSSSSSSSMSPPLNSTARMSFHEKVKKRKRELGFGVLLMRLVFVLCVVFGLEFGFSWVVSGFLKTELSQEIVRNLSEKSRGLKDFNERLVFLKKELEGLIDDDEVSSCSPLNSTWKINQDGLLLASRCTLYKSMTEELSIWGWPLQTAGLLTAGLSARSYAILSGRLTEWSNGEIGYLIRKANSSWTQQKWSASAVQLDPNTWILEYSRSPLTENGKLVSAVLEFLKFRLRREVQKLKQEFWLLSPFTSQHSDLAIERVQIPT